MVEQKKVLSSSLPLIKDAMPICRLCDNRFPVKTRINGEVKNLSKRVYCLSCSPWGCHNTKKLETNPLPTRDKVCIKCDKPYVNQTGKPCHGTLCNACYQAKRRMDRKKELVDLMGGGCNRCGYSKSTSALQFHHRQPSEKAFHINHAMGMKWESLLQEVMKCELLCANCHAEEHS